jgi:glycosyltransferase involved in cell wall biosynthesis
VQIRFLITNAYGGGGTIRTTLTMASALARRGHDVDVVSVFRRRVNPMFPVDDAVRLRPLLDQSRAKPPGRRRARLARRAGKALAGMPSRMIHHSDVRYSRFNLRSDLALLQYLRSLRGGVLVTTRAGLSLASARYVHRSVVRVAQAHVHLGRHPDDLRAAFAKLYPRLDAVVTLTSRDEQAYRALLGDGVPVISIPNAIPDLSGARADPDADAKVVTAAGRLTKPKGFDLLINAWRVVAHDHPDWQLRIHGRGPAKPRLRRQISKAGLGEQVHLMGFTKTLPEQLAASSIFVLSSRFEGFPMVLLEAMACGLPVVSFDCPTGPAELVDDGVTGVLVENGSVPGLVREINRLIDDPELRAKLGMAARQAADDYSSDKIAIRWERLFEQHLTAHGTRRR